MKVYIILFSSTNDCDTNIEYVFSCFSRAQRKLKELNKTLSWGHYDLIEQDVIEGG